MDVLTGVNEDQLTRWATAPSESEETKCQKAVKVIKEAIQKRFNSQVSIYLQGLYKNRTNVRKDSDVDIVARYEGIYFPDLSGLSDGDKTIYNSLHSDAAYIFSQFKSDMHVVLQSTFLAGEVERKDKCIRVKANSYRVNADVVPCFVHKRFRTPYQVEAEGIEFLTDGYVRINSFSEQHFENGKNKNAQTSQMYKAIVRILKCVRRELIDQGVITKDLMPSHFLECLVWNAPDQGFNESTYYQATCNVIAQVYNDMKTEEKYSRYAEASYLKWLFPKSSTKRTPLQAQQFMQSAYTFIGYR